MSCIHRVTINPWEKATSWGAVTSNTSTEGPFHSRDSTEPQYLSWADGMTPASGLGNFQLQTYWTANPAVPGSSTSATSSTAFWDLYGGEYSATVQPIWMSAMNTYQNYRPLSVQIEYIPHGKAPTLREMTVDLTTSCDNPAPSAYYVQAPGWKQKVNGNMYAVRDPWNEYLPQRTGYTDGSTWSVAGANINRPGTVNYSTLCQMLAITTAQKGTIYRPLKIVWPYLQEVVVDYVRQIANSIGGHKVATAAPVGSEVVVPTGLAISGDMRMRMKRIPWRPIQLDFAVGGDLDTDLPGQGSGTDDEVQQNNKQVLGTWINGAGRSTAGADSDAKRKAQWDYIFKEFGRTIFFLEIPEKRTTDRAHGGAAGTAPTFKNPIAPIYEYTIYKTFRMEFSDPITTPATDMLAPSVTF